MSYEPFIIKKLRLPHDGVMPGAAGHKKVIVPKGTTVYCVMCGGKYFWACYLYVSEAIEAAKSFVEQIKPGAKRHIHLDTLIEWNFKSYIPTRVHRSKTTAGSEIYGG